MLRYTLLRLMIFLGCLALLWLIGLRGPAELPWLVVIAAISSMVISAIVLKPFRAEMVQQIQERQAAKAERKAARADSDEAVEDRAQESARPTEDAGADDEEETYR